MIDLEARQAVYRLAIEKFGEEAQLWIVIEEMSELAKEICKFQRGKRCPDDLADEIADVEIMLEQARMLFGVDDLVIAHKDAKIERLRERVRQDMLRGMRGQE